MGFPLTEAIQAGDFLRLCALSSMIYVLLTGCPGFRGDRVNFLLTTWYSAMFWIQCGNNVDNTLIFWLLLSCIYHKTKTRTFFVSPALPVRRCKKWKKAVREHSWDKWPKLAKGIFTPLNDRPSVSAGELTGRGSWLGFRDGIWHQSVGGKQLCCFSFF